MKTLSYSYVKYSPRVSLLLLTVEKIERESFDFALLLLLSFFLSFFSIMHNSKVYSVYEQSAHQTNALLSEIFLFWVRTACKAKIELWLQMHIKVAFLYAILCIITCTTPKLKIV